MFHVYFDLGEVHFRAESLELINTVNLSKNAVGMYIYWNIGTFI